MPSNLPVNKSMNSLEWGLLLSLSILWGGSFFFIGVAVRELPTFTIVVCRVFLAAMSLLVVMKIMGLKLPTSRRVWAAFFVMGVLNNAVPFSLIVWGQAHIASGVASILNATTPLFTVVIAHVLTRDEKMTVTRLLGVMLGLTGVAFMIGTDMLQSLGVNILAQIAILTAAISYALAGVFGRRFRGMGISPVAAATGQVSASSVMLLPIMLAVDQPWTLPVPGLATIGALVGVAILSTALAYILYFRILETTGATNLLLVTLLIPISAILLGVLVLNEVLLAKHFIGMALIGGGLAAIDGRPIKAVRALFSPR